MGKLRKTVSIDNITTTTPMKTVLSTSSKSLVTDEDFDDFVSDGLESIKEEEESKEYCPMDNNC